MGQAAREVPRWKRKKPQPTATVIQLRGRHAKALTRELAATPPAGKEGTGALAPGAWRFRRHLVPFIWLAGLIVFPGVRYAPHPLLWGLLAGAVIPLAAILFSLHLPPWTRRAVDIGAAFTSLWLPVLAVVPPRSCVAWLLLTWAPCMALWVRHYRWRPARPQEPDPGPVSDADTWSKLCEAQRWQATLGNVTQLAGGGRRYPIQCDGIKTVTKTVLAKSENIAGAWHSPLTEVYAERDPKGVPSRGTLTILPGSSLQAGRLWDGRGMTPDGLARIGRFADGADAHIKLYAKRFGCRHDLVAGTTGSGKTKLLELLVFIALQTGWLVPVICDPQEGQSLPFFRDRCIYASGPAQVERRIRGLYAAFMDRSSMLGQWAYSENGVKYPGMPFFDHELTGLPVPWIILDEAHLVLNTGTRYERETTGKVVDMSKIIRKAGGRMTLATQLPSLAEMGGDQALRDMLRGGNVWSGRTANKVSGAMLGLEKDPVDIPSYFEDGTETPGLSYVAGPDRRPDAPMRTDIPGGEHYRNVPEAGRLDDRFLEVMDRAMREAVSPTSAVAPLPVPARREPAAPGGLGKLMQLPRRDGRPAPEPAAKERRCVDAVWQVLAAGGAEMTRGEVIKRTGDLARSWERAPWSTKAIQNALTDLAEGKDPGRPVAKPRDGVYRAVVSTPQRSA